MRIQVTEDINGMKYVRMSDEEPIPSTCYRCQYSQKDGTCSKVPKTLNYINGKQDNCPLVK